METLARLPGAISEQTTIAVRISWKKPFFQELSMPGPGEYRPDPTEGITRIEDLPKPKIRCQSRNYRWRPCPRCGHSAYRDRQVRRTLHDLGSKVEPHTFVRGK